MHNIYQNNVALLLRQTISHQFPDIFEPIHLKIFLANFKLVILCFFMYTRTTTIIDNNKFASLQTIIALIIASINLLSNNSALANINSIHFCFKVRRRLFVQQRGKCTKIKQFLLVNSILLRSIHQLVNCTTLLNLKQGILLTGNQRLFSEKECTGQSSKSFQLK